MENFYYIIIFSIVTLVILIYCGFIYMKVSQKVNYSQLNSYWEGWNYNPKDPFAGGKKKRRIRYLQ